MRARKLLLIAVVLVTAVVVARGLGLWVGGQFFTSPTNPTPAPALVFAAEDLTFGPIPESEPVERELRLTNTTAEPITVERFETSCSCLGVEPAGSLTLAAGETKTLRIKLKAAIPSNAKLSGDGLFDETVTVTAVVPTTVHPTGRLRAEFRYTVRQTVRFEPAVVQLGVVSHREPLTAKATLTLRPPIADVRVLPHPEWAVKLADGGNGRREIVATPIRPGVPRAVNDTLQFVPVGSDGVDRPARPLTLRGEVNHDITSSPTDILLGRLRLGTKTEETIRFVSRTNRKFTVLTLPTVTDDVEVVASETDTLSFTLRIEIRGRGGQERHLSVTVRQDDGTDVTLRIPIRYLGE